MSGIDLAVAGTRRLAGEQALTQIFESPEGT
jgi:hypothetical protein